MIEIMESLALILAAVVLLALSFFIIKFFKMNVEKQSTEIANNSGCRKIKREKRIRNWTDFFWSNSMRFGWITLILIALIIYSIAMHLRFHIEEGLFISVFFSIVTLIFFLFAYISYINFEEKAKARLTDFENIIKAGIRKEISFNGDNLQRFSEQDYMLETDAVIFEFPISPKKINFPPFETRPPKKKIIASRKLEFLILSREYFSICQSATPFDLLNPVEQPAKKQCAPKTVSGECEEHYYSQMRNVLYKDDAIQIIFDNEDDNVVFKCPKMAANRKPAMKALKEKLRITERQRLKKIDEHRKFEDLYDKRLNNDFINYKDIEQEETRNNLKKKEEN